ncbi:hypothetical protein CGRA01v4_01578 [Colletotrichum graminicola]|uniref:Uncharacterized protein n=1 Tax=Colletotrichum graminicola (strain M1.001 / M2 / FGSC 10212) TaxID=645133 RepID=E3QY18_COLGM|nr:uncharacterized protein GLRG_10911 [Colletotrichum graminicola M1.001]EFQ35756.1 hypothetical protein GLRG_10911 [Colletotrichum graminicola M1.001]WDK10299.1 hypothetical protein CGRA01v4_01578 [Colletotrichum graminicola]
MHLSVPFVVTLAALLRLCYGAAFTPPSCIGDITEFPNCEKVDFLTKNCKGQFRQCALGNTFDSDSDDQIAAWQDACGPYLAKGVTTPVAPAATRTLDVDSCKGAAESCAQLSQSTTSCSSAYTKPAELTSCRCQASLVSLASACYPDGHQSCRGDTATTSKVWEFQHCAAATGVLQKPKDTSPIKSAADTSTAKNEATNTLVFGPEATATETTSDGTQVRYYSVVWRVIVMHVPVLLYLLVG